jgi:putative DNA primase/helicase
MKTYRPAKSAAGLPASPRENPNDKPTSSTAPSPWQASPEPWPEAVDGATLLATLRDTFTRFLVLPELAAPTLALWTLHTYSFNLGRVAAYLGLLSPEKRCGKTTALSVLSALVHRALPASNVTPAALFRVIERDGPTLLIDETDAFLGDNEELRGILNAGFTRETAFVIRTVGENHEPKQFRVFGPKLFAAIGKLPGTLSDRSIIVSMRRKLPGDVVERFRGLDGTELQRRCARWTADNEAQLAAFDPSVPDALNDRAADLWRPLLTIADLAGGEWPTLARKAALEFSGDTEDDSQPVKLLGDVRAYFATQHASRALTKDLLAYLNGLEEQPWPTFNHGDGMNARQLADRLKSFGIASRTIRDGEERGKGYHAEDFTDAFGRYLPPSPAQNP